MASLMIGRSIRMNEFIHIEVPNLWQCFVGCPWWCEIPLHKEARISEKIDGVEGRERCPMNP